MTNHNTPERPSGANRSLRERKRERTRRDLTNAALDLFLEKGYEATSVDDIVGRANYSRSTFFRYFGTKEDMLFTAAHRHLDLMRRELDTSSPPDDPWSVARLAGTRQILELTKSAKQVDTCVALWFAEPALRRVLVETWLTWEQVLTEFFTRSLGEEAEIEARSMAAAMIAVFRTAADAGLSGETDVETAIQRGFRCLSFPRPLR